MALIPISKQQIIRFVGKLGGKFIRLVHRTSSVVHAPASPKSPDQSADQPQNNGENAPELFLHLDEQTRARALHPCIFTFWHGQFMLIPGFSPKDVPVANMVARHGDGDLIGSALREFDMGLIRGSGAGARRKNQGGATALREAVRALQSGTTVCMTADVPPGPARTAGIGVVKLAQLSGRPIVPVATASSLFFAFNTWSRMTINLPFSRIGVALGKTITVPTDASDTQLEAARLLVEHELNAATADIYQRVGANVSRATPDNAHPSDAPPHRIGFRLKLYRALTRLATPTAGLILSYRVRQGKEDPNRISERIGKTEIQRPPGSLIWIHAASVGETNAILPLIDELRNQLGDRGGNLSFLLTTGTRTSAMMAAERLSPQDIHQFAPLDAPRFVTRFLNHWQPTLAILTESEIWPNTIVECHTRNIPMALVNARMSPRSFSRWSKHRSLSQPLFSRLRVVLAQNEKLARRFRKLGTRDSRPVGNLKIDAPPLPIDPDQLSALKTAIGQRPVWIAASTHTGEDEVAIQAHTAIAQSLANTLTIIAPRHPERGDEVEALVKTAGLKFARRSKGALPSADTQVYIADTIGELGLFYSVASAAFIGGSITPRGGQNPIEAIRYDTAILTGPNHSNFTDAYSVLLRHGGAIEVKTALELGLALTNLLGDEKELARMRKGATSALESLSGALDLTVDALSELFAHAEKQQSTEKKNSGSHCTKGNLKRAP